MSDRARAADVPDTSRPPRLVARFAVLSALCLALGATTILLFIRHLDVQQAERHAAAGAQAYATGLLTRDVRRTDLRPGVPAGRRSELDRLLGGQLRPDGMLRIALLRADGTITYSTERAEIGRRGAGSGGLREALQGTITSRTESVPDPRGRGRTKVLRSYVPLELGGNERAVARIDQDYGPIAADAREAFLPVAGILEAVLLALYALLLPVLMRASRRIRRQMERIDRQARFDDLTGLPNRRLFLERVEAAVADSGGRPVSVLILDVDRFGQVNDTLGHEAGDRFLVGLGHRLGAAAGDALLARIGGDELGVVAAGVGDEDATALAARLRAALEEPLLIDGIPLDADLSVGIAVHPQHGEDAATLVRHADVALRFAQASHTCIRTYEESQDGIDREQLALLPELRRAIKERELVLHYQLKADLRTGAINGAEALLRWQHPSRGLLPPGAFLPYAEATGIGRDLSRYVVERVIDDLAMLSDLGLRIPIGLNLSPLDLLDSTLPRDVTTLLSSGRIDPELLELEITETAVMAEHERVRGTLGELAALGARLAIDDFGTGYSSLSYLSTLPIDTIKIDLSFVQRMLESPGDAAIVRSVVDLGHNLGLTVVAEGVETKELWDALRALGCDTAQGFYFAMPRPLDDLLARLLSTQAEPAPRRSDPIEPPRAAAASRPLHAA